MNKILFANQMKKHIVLIKCKKTTTKINIITSGLFS